jgi:pimeloyl-ACP methyl ester carboxylesterase
MTTSRVKSVAVAAAAALVAATQVQAADSVQTTHYRTVKVDGLSIFYREAGNPDAPTLLLLHGFPSSSRMYEPLFSRLASHYHLVAPDYPGFGNSDAPSAKEFAYTFEHIAGVMDDFTNAIGLKRYVLYMQDYGGPVGMRLAVKHPDRVRALIIQNAVAHEDGLGPLWKPRRDFWARLTRRRSREPSCHSPRPGSAISVRTLNPNRSILTGGLTNSPSSVDRDRVRFK